MYGLLMNGILLRHTWFGNESTGQKRQAKFGNCNRSKITSLEAKAFSLLSSNSNLVWLTEIYKGKSIFPPDFGNPPYFGWSARADSSAICDMILHSKTVGFTLQQVLSIQTRDTKAIYQVTLSHAVMSLFYN